MDKRYEIKEMADVWSYLAKFTNWAKIEIAVLRAKVSIGELDVIVPTNLLSVIKIDPDEIHRIEHDPETGTGHDVVAFLKHTAPQLPEQLRPCWHEKLTSYDPQDTGLSMQLVASIDLMLEQLKLAMQAVKVKAFEYKQAVMMGRTHGVHAEIITFGVKLANWYDELNRHRERLERLRETLAVGKISGAVGMYTLDPRIEELVCKELGLKPITTTQIISRDLIAEHLTTLAIIGGSLEKFGVCARTLQRTEILETMEFFSKTQRGSSAMPHKKNPKEWEKICGLARLLRGYAMVALENQSTWDERSLDNSSPERVILPDASHVLYYMLTCFTKTMSKWIIYPERMATNIDTTKGLIFSQDVQSLFASTTGLPREEACDIVCQIAQKCWTEGLEFLDVLCADLRVAEHLTREQLQPCFQIKPKLQHVDHIFERVFGTTT